MHCVATWRNTSLLDLTPVRQGKSIICISEAAGQRMEGLRAARPIGARKRATLRWYVLHRLSKPCLGLKPRSHHEVRTASTRSLLAVLRGQQRAKAGWIQVLTFEPRAASSRAVQRLASGPDRGSDRARRGEVRPRRSSHQQQRPAPGWPAPQRLLYRGLCRTSGAPAPQNAISCFAVSGWMLPHPALGTAATAPSKPAGQTSGNRRQGTRQSGGAITVEGRAAITRTDTFEWRPLNPPG